MMQEIAPLNFSFVVVKVSLRLKNVMTGIPAEELTILSHETGVFYQRQRVSMRLAGKEKLGVFCRSEQ